jgi:hypothetical protein
MNVRVARSNAATGLIRLCNRVGRWCAGQDAMERYLSAASDHAEVERRIRELERRNAGPALMTFNR